MTKTRTDYLTIDLNFFSKRPIDVPFLERSVQQVGRLNAAAAVFHDGVLPHIKRYGHTCNRVINIGFYADLGGDLGGREPRRMELHPGSWGDYVNLLKKDEFLWLYPEPGCPQKCRSDLYNDPTPAFGQIQQADPNPWQKLECRLAGTPDCGLDWERIRAVSIVLSPNNCGRDAFEIFISIVQKHKLELLDWLPENLSVGALRSAGRRS